MEILFGIFVIAFVGYLILYLVKYPLIIKLFNKWAKADFVPEKRWNKLLWHGVGSIVASSLLNFLLVSIIASFSDLENSDVATGLGAWAMVIPFLNFVWIFVYGYFYVRYRVDKAGITLRQAVWEMIYAICSIYAIAAAIGLAIYAVMFALMLFVVYVVFMLMTRQTIFVNTGGLFPRTKTMHENFDGTYSETFSNKKYVKDGDKVREVVDK